MTEHDFDKACKLIAAMEVDLRKYLENPQAFTASEYFEDVHCCICETLTLLGVEQIEGEIEYD